MKLKLKLKLMVVTIVLGVSMNCFGNSDLEVNKQVNIEKSFDAFGREIRTTNLPSNASHFPYIAEGVPNWCYEQQPWDDNYWGSLYSTNLIDEGASKVAAFPSDVYKSNNSLSTVIADNYETIDNFIKAQCCVDYRTIDEATYCNAIANGVDLRTTGSGTLQGVKSIAKTYVDYVKNYKVILETEYQILPETAWVMNSAPFNTLNFSVYMRVTPKNIEGGYYNSWGSLAVYTTKYKKSSIKTNQVYEGIVTYTLIKQDDGTWKLNNNSNAIWGQIDPLCDALNGVAPDKKNLAGRENEFNYTWTKDENKYYTRYQKDCVTPE